MTIKEASKKLNLSPQLLRVWCKNGCPFGYIVNQTENRATYLINEEMMKKWIAGELR